MISGTIRPGRGGACHERTGTGRDMPWFATCDEHLHGHEEVNAAKQLAMQTWLQRRRRSAWEAGRNTCGRAGGLRCKRAWPWRATQRPCKVCSMLLASLEEKQLAMKLAMQGHAMYEMRAVCDARDGVGPADAQDARRRGLHERAHRGCLGPRGPRAIGAQPTRAFFF